MPDKLEETTGENILSLSLSQHHYVYLIYPCPHPILYHLLIIQALETTLKTPVGAKADFKDNHDIDSDLDSLLSSFVEDDMRDPYADYSIQLQ